MANDINQCTFTGRLGRDPETKHNAQGGTFTTFTVAVGSQWTNKASGEREEATEWVNVSAFGKVGEICDKYLEKGSRVFIQGALNTRTWDKDGVKQYSTGIVLDKMQMLDPPKDAKSSGQASRRLPKPAAKRDSGYGVDLGFDDDIQF